MSNTVLVTKIETAIRACPEHGHCTDTEYRELVASVTRDIANRKSAPPRTLPPHIAKEFGTRNQGGTP